ncbi:probable ATP synthase subunit 5, mitochondrial [Cephalotrichum gorgonifer]|uniref:ATP synthase subunit 5, mitochondrial n=1 Tax=Cephalotrichum gorgonifer TaxID=2041049 RepID=A0AAE8MS08_9PEZI|nr:probable ATP synthase subunit 5, mitochondrial [Cephalotrichum gorgonifer]
MLARQALFRSVRAATRAPVRTYAAAAAAPKDVQAPAAVFGTDGTYATALVRFIPPSPVALCLDDPRDPIVPNWRDPEYTAAVKTSTLEPTAKAISTLSAIFARDPKLQTVLSAPTLSAEDKSAVVAELAKQAGSTSNETVRNFLSALAENNRLGLLGSVCQKFDVLMAAARGQIEMVVTSAQPLDNKTLTRLETAVSKSEYVGAGKKLKVTNEVNPDIVGGLVVEIGDRTIDLSVSSRINKMNKLLTDSL